MYRGAPHAQALMSKLQRIAAGPSILHVNRKLRKQELMDVQSTRALAYVRDMTGGGVRCGRDCLVLLLDVAAGVLSA